MPPVDLLAAQFPPPVNDPHAKPYATLLWRLSAVALLFVVEVLALSIWLDNSALAGETGLPGAIHNWGAWAVRVAVGFAALFATCAFVRRRALVESISSSLATRPIRRDLLWLHIASMVLFAALSHLLYSNYRASAAQTNALAAAWLAVGIAAIWLGAITFVPAAAWVRLAKGTAVLGLAVLLVAAGSCFAGNAIRSFWAPTSRLTMTLVHFMIGAFLPGVVEDPATMLIGTSRFSVRIAPQCSGLEGMALILAFTGLWLVLFRKEFRFPNALILLPAGVILMFLLNAARIAVLIAIGNAGASRIALGGFHSQAGWIAFNAVALGFAVSAGRIPWLLNAAPRAGRPAPAKWSENRTAAYLMPLIALLGVGMVCAALSGGFDWFYSLRFLAVAPVLWLYRRHYFSLGWRCTWFGPVAGAIIFAIWIGLDRWTHTGSDAMPAALAAASPAARNLWIAGRVLATVTTVPLAEELAFRGYLMRRFIAAEFEAVSMQSFTWPALIASSALFGFLHGDRWFAGTLAGLLYSAAALRRGRIADAVVAHATTNAMLAAYVLFYRAWHLW